MSGGRPDQRGAAGSAAAGCPPSAVGYHLSMATPSLELRTILIERGIPEEEADRITSIAERSFAEERERRFVRIEERLSLMEACLDRLAGGSDADGT